MKRRVIIALLTSLVVGTQLTVYGQNLNPLNLTNIIPPTPEVSSLAKYVDIPVSYSGGVPNVQIPIYTVQNGSLSVPISLSYHAGGIKVGETPTWVGLGWNLNAGGSISRAVRGLPDDFHSQDGYIYTSKTIRYMLSLPQTSQERHELLVNRIGNEQSLDAEPDEYSYSVLGYSGKFYYDQKNRKFVQAPYTRVIIDTVCNSTKQITGFVLTLPNGTKCYFGNSADKSRQAWDSYQNQSSITYTQSSGFALPSTGFSTPHISSWHLLDIIAPTNKSIQLFYSTYNSVDFGRGGESVDHSANGGSCNYEGTDLTIGTKNASFFEQLTIKSKLTRISTDLSDIWFKSNTLLREDVMANEYALDTIRITRKDNSLIKGFVLDYSYFTSTNISGINLTNFYALYRNPGTVYHKRLRLNSVKEFSSSGELPPYQFYYETSQILPDRLSPAQDFWGFYNGAANSYFTIPSVPNSLINSGATGMTNGADRKVNFTYAKACVLNKIVYPTGGSTEYSYESNTANGGTDLGLVGYQYSGLVNKNYSFWANPDYYHNTVPRATYVDSFTVGVISGQAQILTTGCAAYNTLDCPFEVKITGITNPAFTLNIVDGNFNASLPKGKYKITTTLRDETAFSGFTVSVNWQEFSGTGGSGSSVYNTLVGGLRVYKIVSRDGAGSTLSKSLSYTSFDDPTKSSGILLDMPVHAHYLPCGNGGAEPSLTSGYNVLGDASILRIVSYNALPSFSSSGQAVRYTNVTEYLDSTQSKHKTEYTFSNDYFNFVGPSTQGYPYPTHVQRNWQQDLLLNQKKYVNTGAASYRLLEEQKNFYVEYEHYTYDSFAFRTNPLPYPNALIFSYYNFVTEWHVLDSTVNILYSSENDGTAPIIQWKKFFYTPENGYTVSNERSVNSRGQVMDKKSWYPYNYNNVPGFNLDVLKQKNIIEAPIRQEISRNGKLIDGQIVTYYSSGLPKDILQFESRQPIDTTPHNPGTVLRTSYPVKQSAVYDQFGNVLRVDVSDNISKSFIWDYAYTLPVCEITNSGDFARYTSFEADENRNWVIPSATRVADGITGSMCYQLSNGNVSASGLASSNEYVLTYWTKNSNPFAISGTQENVVEGRSVGGWRCFMHRISGVSQITISGSGLIDELRCYPKGAQMSTYTYDPLVGVTSKCDVANRIIYYEYDNFGRLKLIRDQDKNILKTFDYQFQANTNQ